MWPGHSEAGSAISGSEACSELCVPLFVSGRQGFPGKVPCQCSKSGLAAPRGKEAWPHLGEETRASSRVGVQGRSRASPGSFLGSCSPGSFCSPLASLPPAPTHRPLGSSERKPQTFFKPAGAGPFPPGEMPSLRGWIFSSFPLRASPGYGQRSWPPLSQMEMGMGSGWHRQGEELSRPGRYQGQAGMRRGMQAGGRNGRGGRRLEWRPPPAQPCPLGLETSSGSGTSEAAGGT